MKKIILLVSGFCLSILLGWAFVSRYIVTDNNGCGLEPASACETLKDILDQ